MSSATSVASSSVFFSAWAPDDRSEGRNVHIYDAKDRTTVLGGLILTWGVTNANFYSMIKILIVFTGYFVLHDKDDIRVEKNDDQLQPGSYYIISEDPFAVTNEKWLLRTMSYPTGPRIQCFRDNVFFRDLRCVISGESADITSDDDWLGFEPTHIFPPAHEDYWNKYGFGRWITNQPESGGAINSVQNGIMLDSTVRKLFDSYVVSINPDDNYKIVFFSDDWRGLDESRLDQLLRWHFRQAVLANVRGAGEPFFEHYIEPNSDIMGDILGGPKPAERMQYELFIRLAAQVDVHQ